MTNVIETQSKIEITQSTSRGGGECLTAEHKYYEVVFLGIFKPGEYTLILNGIENMFQVG